MRAFVIMGCMMVVMTLDIKSILIATHFCACYTKHLGKIPVLYLIPHQCIEFFQIFAFATMWRTTANSFHCAAAASKIP